MNSNKYIFKNILYMLIDFTQSNDYYSFDNYYFNQLAKNKISNFILFLNEFNPKYLKFFRYSEENNNNILHLKSLSKEEIKENENENVIVDVDNKSEKKTKSSKLNKKINRSKNKSNKKNLIKLKSFNNRIKESNGINDISNNINEMKKSSDNIHILNEKDLKNISNIDIDNSQNNSTNLILNSSNINNSNLITNINNNNNYKILNENYNITITIDKIFILTKISMSFSIKILIYTFFIFFFIFIFFYIGKLFISLSFISNFYKIISDFKVLTSQYNHINRYWNNLKTVFIIPSFIPANDLNNSEEYFFNLNNRVLKIYKYRIKNYKRISDLYDIILNMSEERNVSDIDFCREHLRCTEVKRSNMFLFSNGMGAIVSLYAKEISNYYKLCLLLKNNITKKEDIINNYIDDKYKILTININHILIYLEEIYFDYFLEDEKDIINDFYLIIKILNIIEIYYNVFLNLFSILFVYNFVSKIISSVETSSTSINKSIVRLKIQDK